MRKTTLIAVACAFVTALFSGCHKEGTRSPRGFLIILQAGKESHEGLARAVHALLYAKELRQKGHEVALVFDGAGTEWAEALKQPDHKLHARYEELRQMGIVEEICDFCSGAFKVKDGLKQMSVDTLVSEFEGHPSLAKWISRGYEVLIL